MTDNRPWDDYWRQKHSENSSCLPCADEKIDGALKRWWHSFAEQLPKKARIVDFATGNGIVLQRILAKRRDVKATGIDAANTLPKPSGKFQLRGGVTMENTPFGDNSVDAVTSQFGVEYGNLEKITTEVARIIKPGGQICFVMHRKPGPIIAHNEPRLEGLQWALEDEKLPAKALNWINQRALVGTAIPPLFHNSPELAAKKFGSGSAGHEFATAILQSLAVGQTLPAAESQKMIGELEKLARNEIGRIESLINAGMDAESFAALKTRLIKNSFAIMQAGPLEETEPGADFGWIAIARKADAAQPN